MRTLILYVMILCPLLMLSSAEGTVSLNYKNFAFSTLDMPGGLANDATTLTVQTDEGARFPGNNFRAVIFDAACSSAAFCNNKEIVTLAPVSPGADIFDIIARGVEDTSTPAIWVNGSKIFHTITGGLVDEIKTEVNNHLADTSDPHSVTKDQVGLGNVENTALSTWAGAASIATLGTVTTGTWNASDIALGTYTSGDYVSGVTSGGGLVKTGTEGATLGLRDDCATDEGIKWSGSSWICTALGGSGSNVGTDTIWNTKGDLAVGTGSDSASILSSAANYSILYTDSTQGTGLNWLLKGANDTWLHTNSSGVLEWTTIAGGGDVAGPATHAANYIPQWNSVANSKTLVAGKVAPTGDLVGTNDNQVLTGKEYDAEAIGNSIILPVKQWIGAAGCNDTIAGTYWDLKGLSEQAATPACVKIAGTGPVFGVLDFPDGSTSTIAHMNYMLPSDFDPTKPLDLHFKWLSDVTTGYVIWEATVACVDDGETNEGASYPAATAVLDQTKSVANQTNDAILSNLPKTGCGPLSLMHLKIRRDPNNALDTMEGTARFMGLEITFRRRM